VSKDPGLAGAVDGVLEENARAQLIDGGSELAAFRGGDLFQQGRYVGGCSVGVHSAEVGSAVFQRAGCANSRFFRIREIIEPLRAIGYIVENDRRLARDKKL
jgi:hypothetical protein